VPRKQASPATPYFAMSLRNDLGVIFKILQESEIISLSIKKVYPLEKLSRCLCIIKKRVRRRLSPREEWLYPMYEVKRLRINYKTLEEFQKFREFGLEELSMKEDLEANIVENDSESPCYGI
jgi:hypothetical protein